MVLKLFVLGNMALFISWAELIKTQSNMVIPSRGCEHRINWPPCEED